MFETIGSESERFRTFGYDTGAVTKDPDLHYFYYFLATNFPSSYWE